MNKTATTLLTTLFILPFGSAKGDLLDIPDTPLFLGVSVDPNIFFQVDDSGSMDWEFLTPKHWHFCSYDPHATGSFSSDTSCGWEVDNGLVRAYGNFGYRYFTYIYRNGDNVYADDCNWDSRNSIEACLSAGDKDWRIYSADLNVIYYNPSQSYVPWSGPCLQNGTICGPASFTQARSNPREGTNGYTTFHDLSHAIYEVWHDDKGFDPSDARPLRGNQVNVTTGANQIVDLWDSHARVVIESNNAKIYKITYAPNTSGIHKTETLMHTMDISSTQCFNALGPKPLVEAILTGQASWNSTQGEGCRTVSEAQANFANWYQYHRKRSWVAKSAISTVIDGFSNFRFGLSVINNDNALFVEMPPSSQSDYTTHNFSLLAHLYDYPWQAMGTPLRRGLEKVGMYYDNTLSGKADPITHACQQNFTILLTDGYWNGSSPSGSIGDADGDGISITVADVARHYYLSDLSPFDNIVVPNPFDPATYQHMVTFTVAFGVSGDLIDLEQDGWPNPALAENSHWGNPFSSNPAKIDDLWHAAFNSKGTFVGAQTPDKLAQELSTALAKISNRVSSAAPSAQNSRTLQTGSKVFQSRFNSENWVGELLAFDISTQGVISDTPTWNAHCLLTGGDCEFPSIAAANNPGKAPNDRVILTVDDSGVGIPFRWPQDYTALNQGQGLPSNIVHFLAYAPFSATTQDQSEILANQAYGQHLLDFIRGQRSEETQFGGQYGFRNRQGVLGDLVHSPPTFVSAPARYYPDSFEALAYKDFKTSYAGRPSVIYVGGNDGMLHGFSSQTGEEVLAFVPGYRTIYESLPELSQHGYMHRYFVDGSLSEGDVFIQNQWKTMLVSSLGKGGQSLFGLDITDPSTFSESNASQIFLWNFSDEDDPDLGFVMGSAPIVKMRYTNGQYRWAVLLGNGYNNTQNDGYASTTGKASLMILFIENGLDGTWTLDSDYIKIEVGVTDVSTPNGLATPYPVDIDGDLVVDYVYAGDLKGQIWKFNLTDTDPVQWKSQASLFFAPQYSAPGDQPITAPLVVGPHPNGLSKGVMVYFGTGKYLESDDSIVQGATTQTFYALWDKMDGSVPLKSNLLQQSILDEVTHSFDTTGDGIKDTSYEIRHTSDHPINYKAPEESGDPPMHDGWYMDLKVQSSANNFGEKQTSRPILRNGNVIFSTLIPPSSACEFGGSSWIMELDASSGGTVKVSPFDFNQDNEFTQADYINVGDLDSDGEDDWVPGGGRKSEVGITSTPTVFKVPEKDREVKVVSGSTGLDSFSENPGSGPHGRQNWRQIEK